MRSVFKTTCGTNLIDTLISCLQQIVTVLQPFFKKPFARGGVKDLLELLLECRQASATESGEIIERKVAEEISLHDLTDRGLVGKAEVTEIINKRAVHVA